MTPTQRAAMQAALEWLEHLEDRPHVRGSEDCHEDMIAELRAALAEPEPVAWTPVGEAMPKSGAVVLACYRNRLGNLRRIRAHWIAAKTEEVDGDFDYGEYDEETDRCWTPEGWYECIDNWGDYSSVAVCEGEVTHWMPLPLEPGSAPPRREWQSLTQEELEAALGLTEYDGLETATYMIAKANAIEAALKEKNG